MTTNIISSISIYKISLCFIFAFAFGLFFSYQKSERTIIVSTSSYSFSPNDYIGRYDYLRFSLGKSYWITSIDYTIKGTDKNSLHHAVIQNQSRKDYTCQEKIGERIHGVGKEFNPLSLPKGYAYPVKAGDQLTFLTHIVNPYNTSRPEVTFQAVLKVKPKLFSYFSDQKPIQPIWLDVVNCSIDPTFFIDPHVSKEFKIPQKIFAPFNGKIVLIGGHFHDFGTEMNIFIGKDKYVFTPTPKPETIEKIDPMIFSDNSPKVEKDDLLDMQVIYQNTSDKTVDGMGIGMVYIAKD